MPEFERSLRVKVHFQFFGTNMLRHFDSTFGINISYYFFLIYSGGECETSETSFGQKLGNLVITFYFCIDSARNQRPFIILLWLPYVKI